MGPIEKVTKSSQPPRQSSSRGRTSRSSKKRRRRSKSTRRRTRSRITRRRRTRSKSTRGRRSRSSKSTRRAAADEKLTKKQIVGELQALRTAREQEARDLVSASDKQYSLKNRIESLEKFTRDGRKVSFEARLETLRQALGSAAEKGDRDRPSTSNRQSSLDNRVESLEQFTHDQIAHELQAFPEHRMGSIEKVTKDQIAGELQVRTAREHAARDRLGKRHRVTREVHE